MNGDAILKASIVILNYNSFEDVNRLLIDNFLDLSAIFSVIIVDNFSLNREGEEKLYELIKNNDNIHYIKNNENSGYAKGNNIGIKKALELGAEYAYIVNPDIVIKDNSIFKKMIDEADKINDFTLMGVKVDNIAPYFSRPSWVTFLFPPLLRIKDKYLNSIFKYYSNEQNIFKVYRIYGCFMLLSIKSFMSIDMFDESTFLYGEENIIAEKLFKNNKSMYYTQKFSISHETQGSTRSLKFLIYKYIYVSDFIYFNDYRGFGKLISTVCACNNLIWRFVVDIISSQIK